MTVPVHGLPPLLRRGLVVAIVPPPLRQGRWLTVTTATEGDGSGQLVAFEGVRDLTAASLLAGKSLLACVDDLPDDLALLDLDALLGRSVQDEEHGLLGTICEVLVGPAQDVWVIDGPYGQVLLPAVDEFVLNADEGGPIEVRLPVGAIGQEGHGHAL